MPSNEEHPIPLSNPEHEKACAALARLADEAAFEPELGELLLSLTLKAINQLGLFLADHPERADVWAESTVKFPTVVTREPGNLESGLEVVEKVAAEQFTASRRKNARHGKKIPGFDADSKSTQSASLKNLLRLHMAGRENLPLNAGEWAESFLEAMYRQYPWGFDGMHGIPKDVLSRLTAQPFTNRGAMSLCGCPKGFFTAVAENRRKQKSAMSRLQWVALKQAVSDHARTLLPKLSKKRYMAR